MSGTAIAAFVFSPPGAAASTVIATLILTIDMLGYAALLIPARHFLRNGRGDAAGVAKVLFRALPSILRVSLVSSCGRFFVRCHLPD